MPSISVPNPFGGTIENAEMGGDIARSGIACFYPSAYNSVAAGTWALTSGANFLEIYNSTTANGDEIRFVSYLGAGTYTMTLAYRKNADEGILKIYIDSDLVMTVDMYNSTELLRQRTAQTSITLATDGVKTIRCVVDGKHASSSGYLVFFGGLSLHRTA